MPVHSAAVLWLSLFLTIVGATSTGVRTSAGVIGVDVDWEDHYSVAEWSCFRKAGYSMAIIEAWNGGANTDLCGDIAAARSAEFAHISVYLFLSPGTVSDPKIVFDFMWRNCPPGNKTYDMVWFDIETCSNCGWHSDHSYNVDYIKDAINVLTSKSPVAKVGFYSNANGWPQVMGGATDFATYPIWYANWDGSKNFDDFKGFGGWKKPVIKQYNDVCSECKVDADVNWAPTYPF